jgi:hypothetical protein
MIVDIGDLRLARSDTGLAEVLEPTDGHAASPLVGQSTSERLPEFSARPEDRS